jgi:hypothetical protein
MKSKTTQARVSSTPDPFVRLGRGLEYPLIIQRGKGRNAEFIAGVHFADKPTRRELRQWRDAIQRGIEPNGFLREKIANATGERTRNPLGKETGDDEGRYGPIDNEANARLIAAAPELLAVLKRLCSTFCACCYGSTRDGTEWREARAAIDKVEGRVERWENETQRRGDAEAAPEDVPY